MFAAKTALFVLADGNEENAAVFIVVDVRKELIEFVYYCFFSFAELVFVVMALK